MIHYLVTGSSGFLGSQFCDSVLKLGNRVTAFDVHENPISGYHEQYRFIQGDLSTGEGLDEIPWSLIDVVVHFAAMGVKSVARDWQNCTLVNLLGTSRLLKCLQLCQHSPFLVYAHSYYEDFIDKIPSFQQNPYIVTKYVSTEVVRHFSRGYAGKVMLAKIYQVYGRGDAPKNLIPYVINCLENHKVAHLGSGRGKRDWIAIDDVVEAIQSGIQEMKSGEKRCCEFEIGTGEIFSVKEVLERLVTLMNKPMELLDFDPSRDRDDLTAVGCAHNKPSGWIPRFALNEGLRRVFQNAE
jgi:UDP-N-acetylglucosamine 4-epimerase